MNYTQFEIEMGLQRSLKKQMLPRLQTKKANAFLFILPSTGAFPNQLLEGVKQLYELEPFIKAKPYLTNQWEKISKLTNCISPYNEI